MSRARLWGFVLVLGASLLLALTFAEPQAAAQAPDLAKLEARFNDASANRETLRLDLLTLQRLQYGSAQAVRAAELLGKLPAPLDLLDSSKIPADDRFDWQPKELVAVLGEHRGRQGQLVHAVAISPDGKTIASGGLNAGIRIWDPAKLRQRYLIPNTGYVYGLAFSQDSKWVVAACSGAVVQVWDVSGEKPKSIATLKAGSGPVYGIAISKGKKIAAGCHDNLIRMWDLSGEKPMELTSFMGGHSKPITSVAFSPEGNLLLSGSNDGTARAFDITGDPKERNVLEGHGKEVTCVAFSPNGRSVATGGIDGSVRIWVLDGAKPKVKSILQPGPTPGAVHCLSFSYSGRTLAIGGADKLIRLWDVTLTEPKPKAVLEGHAGVVYSLSWSPDGGLLASGSGDWTVRTWNMGTTPKEVKKPYGHLSRVYGVQFQPTDTKTLASCSWDSKIRQWNVAVADAKEKSSFAPKEGQHLYAMAYTPDGKQIAAGGNSTVAWLLDAATGREVRRFTSNPTAIGHLLISPDAKHLFTSCRKEIHQFDLGTGKELRYLEEHETSISGLALTPDGRYILSGSGHYLYENGKIVVKDGKYVYTDCFLRVWDASRGRLLHAVKHEVPVSGLASSPDGKQALSGGWDSNARAWNLTADPPAEATKVAGGNGHLYYFTYAPDGKTYATFGSGQKLVLWETATHKKLKEWPFEEPVSALAFASDGRHLAAALNTGPVYVLRVGKVEEGKTGAK